MVCMVMWGYCAGAAILLTQQNRYKKSVPVTDLSCSSNCLESMWIVWIPNLESDHKWPHLSSWLFSPFSLFLFLYCRVSMFSFWRSFFVTLPLFFSVVCMLPPIVSWLHSLSSLVEAVLIWGTTLVPPFVSPFVVSFYQWKRKALLKLNHRLIFLMMLAWYCWWFLDNLTVRVMFQCYCN